MQGRLLLFPARLTTVFLASKQVSKQASKQASKQPNTWHLYKDEYANRTLRFSSQPWRPYSVHLTDNCDEDELWGLSGSIVDNITASMGLRYKYKAPKDNMWGYRVPNGTWTGMLGDLQRNESELAVGPFLITTIIDGEFLFGSVFLVDNLRFLAGLKQPFFSAVFSRVSPFDIELWVLVGLTLLLLSYLSVKLVRLPRMQHDKGFLRTYGDIFFIYFAATMQKHSPTEHVGGGVVFRGLHCLWLVASFFAMNFFTASMRADLLVKVEAPRIRTTADVLRNPNTRILLFGSAGFTELFLYTNEDSYAAVYDQVRRTGGELHPSEIYTDMNFRDVLDRKAVMLQEEKGTMEDQIRRNCPAYMGRGFFYFSEESLGLLVLSWVTRKDFDPIIHREMNYRIRWLVDTGMVQFFMRDVSPGPTACWLQQRHKSDMDGRMLEFEDLEAVFVLYALLLQLALAAFIIECLGAVYAKGCGRFCPTVQRGRF